MIDLFAAWVWFPLVALGAFAGWGLLVDAAARRDVPGATLPALGFAAVVCVTQLLTWADLTAELAVPVVLAGGIAGLVLGRARIAPDRLAALAGLGVFAVLGAPVVLSGEATFAGYSVLGDTAIHFVLVDHLMHAGRDLSGLEPSSYANAVTNYLQGSYPTGAHTALGALQPVSGHDTAWVFQPYISLLAAITAGVMWTLAEGLTPRSRAAAAAVAALPALYVGFVLVASVKEVATVVVVTLLAALAVAHAGSRPGVRRVIPLAVATGAGLGIVSLAIAPWLGLALLVALWRARARGLRALLPEAALLAGLAALLAAPALSASGQFVEVVGGVTTNQVEIGNLLRVLDLWQALPIWPVGDYRLEPAGFEATLAVGAGALAVAIALARLRSWRVWVYLGISVIAALYVIRRGSPWADAKALMIASPAVALAAAVGAFSRRGAERTVLAAVLVGGVLWSAALAYHDVQLAPRERLMELEVLAEDAQGPTLLPEFEEFAKHFARAARPVSPGEPYVPEGFPRSQTFGRAASLTEVGSLEPYREIILRRDPRNPVPPAGYGRASATEHYVRFVRDGDAGDEPCDGDAVVVDLTGADLPRDWAAEPDGVVVAPGQGELRVDVALPAASDYRVWLGRSIGREVHVYVDDRRVGSVEDARNYPGVLEPVGVARGLEAGRHELRIVRGGGTFEPGDGSGRRLGPLVLSTADYACSA